MEANELKLLEMIAATENTLFKYAEDLSTNPNSLFARGMVKNATEYLAELRIKLIEIK